MSVNLFSITKHGHFARCMTILSIAFVLASTDAAFLMAQQSDAPDSQNPDNLADTNTPRAGVLTLIDGSQVPGQLRSSSNPDVLQWLANGFVTPFQFRSEAIESIKFPRISNTELNTDSDEFAIEFTNRDIVYGNIISWVNGLLTISTDTCGELIVPADSISSATLSCEYVGAGKGRSSCAISQPLATQSRTHTYSCIHCFDSAVILGSLRICDSSLGSSWSAGTIRLLQVSICKRLSSPSTTGSWNRKPSFAR